MPAGGAAGAPPLLVRPRLLPGESLPSWLARLAAANGRPSPAALAPLLLDRANAADRQALWSGGPSSPVTYARLAALTRTAVGDLHAATRHRYAAVLVPPGRDRPTLALDGGPALPLLAPGLATRAIRPADAAQFCPACLAEAAYHRARWLPAAVSVCLRHRLLLLHRCPACGAATPVTAIVAGRCGACEADLAAAPAASLGGDRAGLFAQEVIQALLETGEPPRRADQPLPDQPADVLFRILDGVRHSLLHGGAAWPDVHGLPTGAGDGSPRDDGGLADGPDARPPYRTNPAARLPAPAQSYRLYTTALGVLLDWPGGLHAFLDAYQARHPGPRPQGNAVCAKLGALFSQWVQREWHHPAFAFLQEAVDDYLLRDARLVQSVLRSGRYRGQPDQLARSAFVTTKQAARILGVDAGGMRLLLRTGRLVAHEVLETRRGGRFQMLARGAVEALATEVRQEVSLAEAQRLLGVERTVVKGLVAAGLLAVARRGGDGSPRWAFTRAAVDDCLRAALRHTAALPEAGGPSFSLTQAGLALGRIGLDGAGILAAVAAGELRAYRPPGAPATLGTLRFTREDLAAHRRDFAARRGWLRPSEVMRLLGIDHTRLRRLVAAGLLVPVKDRPAIRFFARAAVAAFQEEYVSSAGAARLLGVSRNAVQRWTARGRLTPVCGPQVDGGHTYLYRRADLVRWRAARLTFGEAQALLGVSKATLDRWAKQGTPAPLVDMGGTQRWFARQDVVRLMEGAGRGGGDRGAGGAATPPPQEPRTGTHP